MEDDEEINIEFIQNAQINLKTVLLQNPALGAHPLMVMISEQLHNGLGEHSVRDL